MKTETLKVIQGALTFLEESKGILDDEEKKRIDECMFCFRNCYTENETVRHMTDKFPSSVPAVERDFFKELIALTDENLGEAYLKEAEDCETQRRIKRRHTAEEPKHNQLEASTSHKCDGNCNRHRPT